MKKMVVVGVLVAIVAHADLVTKQDPATFRKAAIARAGGYVVRPGSVKGSIVFINAQNELNEDDIHKAVAALGDKLARYDIRVVKTIAEEPAILKLKFEADVAVIVLANDLAPALLVAPEDHWAAINVRKVSHDLKGASRDRFFASRCRKEILRAFTFACGGIASSFEGNILDITKPNELDLREEFIPFDKFAAITKHLSEIGVTPRKMATYKRACEEGWAPAPTHDVQKAIWDKVHEMPTEPIKIKPETKKVAN